jgi:uncharacterized protein YraI
MKRMIGLFLAASFLGMFLMSSSAAAGSIAQAPQPSVTGTPEGARIRVPDRVNVRLGPSTNYDQVGVLVAGQVAAALGRSPGGEWIQIAYPGVPGNVAWVYTAFVVLENVEGQLPIVEPPPTPTPRTTSTIDPTLAAQFNLGSGPPTSLPTFTSAPPVVQPTLAPVDVEQTTAFPPILAIFGLFVVGLAGLFVSLLRGR